MSESTEQRALFEWAGWSQAKYPDLALMYHVPNGGKRDVRTAVNLKREGVKAGVPDICLPVARGGHHGLYIELKAGKGEATVKQLEWLDGLREQGYIMVGWRLGMLLWGIWEG